MRQNHTSSSKSSKSNHAKAETLLSGPESSTRPAASQTQRAAEKKAGAINSSGEFHQSVVERVDSVKRRARYDRPGHLEEAHAERLLHMSARRTSRDEFALVFDSAASDDLATELAEQAVSSMMGGGETWLDMVDAPVEEDDGGPFLETRGAREFAAGPEAEDDTAGFMREALPTPSARPPAAFEGVRRGRRSS